MSTHAHLIDEVNLLKQKLADLRENIKAEQYLLACIIRAKGEVCVGTLENGNMTTYMMELNLRDVLAINANLMRPGDLVIEEDKINRKWLLSYIERRFKAIL